MITNFKTDFNVVLNKPMYAMAAHGETLQFVANLFNDAVSVDLNGYTMSALYREFGNTSSYYVVPGSIETSGNTASFTWTKECDFGKCAYMIYLVAEKGEEVSYPARWELELYDVPGYTSYPVVPVPPILDFDKYELLNAPWMLSSELSTVKLSKFENDVGFITSADIPEPIDAYTKEETDELLNKKATVEGTYGIGYLAAFVDEANTIGGTNLATIDVEEHLGDSMIHVTAEDKENWNAKAEVSSIPLSTSQLANDSGFITSADIPQGEYLPLSGGTMTGTTIATVPVGPAFVATGRDDDYITVDGTNYYKDHIASTSNSYWFPDRSGQLALKSDLGMYDWTDVGTSNVAHLYREYRMYTKSIAGLTPLSVDPSELSLEGVDEFRGELQIETTPRFAGGTLPIVNVDPHGTVEWIGPQPVMEKSKKYHVSFRVNSGGQRLYLECLAPSIGNIGAVLDAINGETL